MLGKFSFICVWKSRNISSIQTSQTAAFSMSDDSVNFVKVLPHVQI